MGNEEAIFDKSLTGRPAAAMYVLWQARSSNEWLKMVYCSTMVCLEILTKKVSDHATIEWQLLGLKQTIRLCMHAMLTCS